MKYITVLLLCLFSAHLSSQGIQYNAPWMSNDSNSKNSKKTFKEITDAAEAYFSTIDKFKKGSGLKPYERWKYHTSFFVKPDGTMATSEDLLQAWKKKNAMNASQRSVNDVSNWTSIGPFAHNATGSSSPGQGRLNTIAEDPSDPTVLYAGAPAGGLWKSVDSGVNWTSLTDHLPQIGVSGIAIHPTNSNIIYIATGDDDSSDSSAVGIWKSLDGGTTWNTTGSLTGNPYSMNEIYIHPNNPNTVLVATSSGVHKTTDGGTSWTRKLTGNIIDIKMKPGDPTIWYAASNSTFYRSVDTGESFSAVGITGFANSGKIVIDVTPADPELVYFVSATYSSVFNGVYRSEDSGVSFEKTNQTSNFFVGQAWYDLALAVSDTNPNIVYVGEIDLWKSNNSGDSFTKVNSWNDPEDPAYTHADIHFLRFFNEKLFAGTDGGVYVSSNATYSNLSFTDLSENLVISQFYKISVANQYPGNMAGGLQDNGIYAYDQSRWNVFEGGDGMTTVVDPVDPEHFYGFIQYGGGLRQTEDAGKTRSTTISTPSNEIGPNDSGGEWVTPLTMNSQGEIYAGYKELYKIENDDWVQVSDESFSDDLDHIEIDPNDDDNIYVSEKETLYRSTNAGTAFTEIHSFSTFINSIEISNTDSNTAWIVTSWSVYKTTNLLDPDPVFTDITGNLPSDAKFVLQHHKRSTNNTIYLGTALGVYTTNDDISDWQPFDNNLPNVAVRDLKIHEEDALLIAATYGRGLFQTPIPEQLPEYDVRLVNIHNPTNHTILCGNTLAPGITVQNRGANTITAITVNYTLDGGGPNVYNWAGNLDAGQTTDIAIPNSTVSEGSHTLFVDITTNNDAYDSNNSYTVNFLVNAFNDTPTVVNSFENDEDVLISRTFGGQYSSYWTMGEPGGVRLNAAATGDKAYFLDGFFTSFYFNNSNLFLYTKCYDLTTITNPVLSFNMAFDIQTNEDYLIMEYSTDNGLEWNTLGSTSDPNWYTSSTTANGLPGNQWTGTGGSNDDFHNYSYDLSSFSNESNIVFRFKLATDTGIGEEGAVIDDLVINGTLSTSSEQFQNSLSIYPNPSSNIFNIEWNTNETATIDVYNYLGKLIVREKISQADQYSLNLNGHARGLYLVKIAAGNKQATKKIVLE